MGKTFVYNTGKPEQPQKTFSLEYGLFFDGTLNNKDNTLLREKVENGTATAEEKKIYRKEGEKGWMDYQGVGVSYGNDYTNVARLWKYCKENYAIYIEGIGTITKARDDSDGFMFGAGKTGVRMKVRKGCEELAKKIGDAKKDKRNTTCKLLSITLDVFGFSRGATAARNFVHEVNVKKAYQIKPKKEKSGVKAEKITPNYGNDFQTVRYIPAYKDVYYDNDNEEVSDKLNGKMPPKGHLGYMLLQNGFTWEEVENLTIKIRFVGVYDTVSSYYKETSIKNFLIDQQLGSPEGNIYFADDVTELGLKNLGALQKAVHFTAMDEHRYNFALTRFPGATEKEFPGVHCDIGGAYLNEPEMIDEIEVGFVPSLIPTKRAKQHTLYLLKRGYWGDDSLEKLKTFAANLIENCWYKKEQLFINNFNMFSAKGKDIPFPSSWNGLYDKLTGKRDLRKEYSYIPLLFMSEYFKNTLGADVTKVITDIGKFESTFSVDRINILKKAKDHLRSYVMDNKGKPWTFLSNEHFKLRNEIFEKKKKRLLEKSKEAEKLNKYSLYEPAKRDGYLEKVYRENEMQKMYSEDMYNERMNEIEARQTKMLNAQGILEILRNEYFHWSANKDWFGMNPTESRKRKIY